MKTWKVMTLAVGLLMLQVPAGAAERGEAWTCSVDAIGATLTLCQTNVGHSNRLYLTDVVIQSTTTTVGQFLLRGGTGANCGADTVSLFPSAATVVRIAYTANTAAPTVISLKTPVSTARGSDLCILCIATQTCSAQLSGFAAP